MLMFAVSVLTFLIFNVIPNGEPADRMAGKNSTESTPQSWIGRFTRLGYDLYRFDREWIADWASDATALPRRAGLGCEASGAQPIR